MNKMKFVCYNFLGILAMMVTACNPSAPKEAKQEQQKVVNASTVTNEEDQIIKLVINLEEVKCKDEQVKTGSQGKRRLSTYVETEPTAADPYYWVKVAEDNGGSYVTYYSFAVHSKTHQVSYYDVTLDSLVSLNHWRKTTPVDER